MNPYLSTLIVVLSVFVPSALAVGLLWLYRKWLDREGKRCPVGDKRIHGPGEQLRKRIELEADEMMGGLVVLFFIGPYFLAIWALRHVEWTGIRVGFGEWLWLSAFLVVAGWATHRILRHGMRRRRANAGLRAELYTAQELNRLMQSGCHVLHDVPAEGFNLDHVVISPAGVYLVETKSVRKPLARNNKHHFKVEFDGEKLRFPTFTTDRAVQQARRQAQWLSEYLRGALNRSVRVHPTIALPGWWIDGGRTSGGNAVQVFNPAGRGAMFMAESRATQLDTSTAALVMQALLMRYPVSES
ncbi:NERD domain-containing protein [Lysobacter sp. F60174L2]|uniref:NERD domain-containing protein n=1 Tax=Lysobacter sp. F60174L2 TaxID=3459295 RepID=UPI00403D6121